MADIDEKVMAFVEETLKKSPRIRLEELFEKAKQVSSSIGELSKRQFNARYPLQAKRRKAQAVRSKTKAKARPKATAKVKASPSPKAKPRAAKKETPPPAPTRTRGRIRTPKAEPVSTDRVRQVLLQFAMDIAAAEERKQLVKVMANVDRYVEQAVKAMGRS